MSLRTQDSAVLAWMDRLQQATADERAGMIEHLAASAPTLHLRLERLLAAAAAPDASMAVLRPFSLHRAAPVQEPGPQAGAAIGGYRVVRELGRGGMSVVWLAERSDGLVKRAVALKVPLFTLNTAAERARFERERDILAALDHPQIARLYDAGISASGQPFIALENVDGRPITTACDELALGLRDRLALFLQVLDAVDHAHKHLVVHRDIKPSNILVDANQAVKLLDFGIAKLLDESELGPENLQLTLQAGCAMTPRYAAPEQLNGGAISTATDIYALGVLLHELLTGQSPYGPGPLLPAQWIAAVSGVEPRRPSQVVRGGGAPKRHAAASALAGDLDTIVLKALRKNPADRYASVERFGDDIRRYLAHRPIMARQPSVAYTLKLFVRRHAAASVASVLAACAVAAFAGFAWQQHRESVEQGLRAAAVRDFMFDLIDDAEPDEHHPEADVTGIQMVTGAIARARRSFSDRPRLRGELLGELARMQARLGDEDGAAKVLGEANGLLEKLAPANDPLLNRTRAQLATLAFNRGDADQAERFALLARSGCTGTGVDCAKVRAYTDQTLSHVALLRGQTGAALVHMRDSISETARGFGSDHSETALAWQSLAVMARNSGDLLQAQSAIAHALDIASHSTLRAAERVQLSGTQALLDYDFGRFDAAAAEFGSLASQERGAEARAMHLRLLAQVLLAQGLPEQARAKAAEAIALAPQGAVSPELLFAQQARARSLDTRAPGSKASSGMAEVLTGLLRLGYAPTSLEVLRGRRFHADLLAREGALDAAASELREVIALQAAAPPGQSLELAQSLDLAGAIERLRSQPRAALDLHARATPLWRDRLPPEHPWRLRNQLYRAAGQLALDQQAASRQAFTVLAKRYAELFPESSAWKAALSTCATSDLSNPGLSPRCELLL